MEAPLEQLSLRPLLGRIDAPAVVPTSLLATASTYRQAVRLCWALRRVRNMTQRHLAVVAGLRPQLVTDYLNPDDRPGRRDLPADRIADFEQACGNSAVTQWLAARHRFTLLEELQAERAAA